ncbi:MAG: DUF2459 domain-containing protein [Polaribacter sp.]
MKIVKKFFKWLFYLFLIPITYVLISLILTSITIDREIDNGLLNKSIYLTTNGVHLDIIIPVKNIDSLLLSGIKKNKTEKYLSFGWGEENFYLNTPTWADLTFKNTFKALFLKSATLIHITRYKNKRLNWIEIKVSESELQKLNNYLSNTFQVDKNGFKMILENRGYSYQDDFYRAKGSYSCFKTCNSWANKAFKESGLKASLWTPFDFGLLNKYN